MTPKQEETLRKEVESVISKSLQLMRGNSAEALKMIRQTLAKTIKSEQRGLEALLYAALAEVHKHTNTPEEIAKNILCIKEICPFVENTFDLARLNKVLGTYYREQSEFVPALEYLFKAKFLFESLQKSSHVSSTLNTIGILLRHTGNYDTALEYMFQALRIEEHNEDKAVVIKLMMNIGRIYGFLGNKEKAIEYLHEVVDLCKKYHDNIGLALAYENLAWLSTDLNHSADEVRYYKKAIALQQKMGGVFYIPPLLDALGIICFRQKKYAEALKMHRKSYALAKTLNHKNMIARSSYHLAKILNAQGKTNDAIDTATSALEIMQGTNQLLEIFDLHEILATLYSESGMYKEAFEHKKLSGEIEQKMKGTERMKSITTTEVAETLYRLEKKQKELEERTRKAEEEARQKEQKLQEVSANLTQSMKTLKEVEEAVKPYLQKSDGELKALAETIYKGLSKTIKTQRQQSPDKYFDKSYQEFIQRLHKSHPVLTPTEIKVCILIKLNYSNKQMGDMLNVSELTIKTHRARIRKKMLLHPQENLLNVLLRV